MIYGGLTATLSNSAPKSPGWLNTEYIRFSVGGGSLPGRSYRLTSTAAVWSSGAGGNLNIDQSLILVESDAYNQGNFIYDNPPEGNPQYNPSVLFRLSEVSYAFINLGTYGVGDFYPNAFCVRRMSGGVFDHYTNSLGFQINGAIPINWTLDNPTGTNAAIQLQLWKDSTDNLGQRRGTNPQVYNIYNTFTSTTSYERGYLKWNSNVFQIGTEKGSGGGSVRQLEFLVDGIRHGITQRNGWVLADTGSIDGGSRSVIAGGEYNTVNVPYLGAFVSGSRAHAYRNGQRVLGGGGRPYGGQNLTGGPSQLTENVISALTTNNTPTLLKVDSYGPGNEVSLTIPNGRAMYCTLKVFGIRSDGALTASFQRDFVIKNVGGTTSIEGPVNTIGTDRDQGATISLSVAANDTNDTLEVTITSRNSETWRWNGYLEALEILYGT